MSGGLEIKFFGRESRKRGASEERLRASCHDLVKPVLGAMIGNPDTIEISSSNAGEPSERVLRSIGEALQVVALEHKHCGWDDRGNERCPVPDLGEETPWSGGYDVLYNVWATSTEVFMDTLCAHLQMRDLTDWSCWYNSRDHDHDPEDADNGWAGNLKRRDRLISILDEVLIPHGFHVAAHGEVVLAEHAGTYNEIEGPSLEALDKVGWGDVAEKMREAVREIRDQNYGDAVTDVGTGMQRAFTRAGYPGKVLGDQVRAARQKVGQGGSPGSGAVAAFAGTHSQLGAAADSLSSWIASVRNQHSDAHDGREATRAEADLALRVGLAMAAWLADAG